MTYCVGYGNIMVVMGATFIILLLFQIGGCFIWVFLYKISTTGTSGRNKKRGGCFLYPMTTIDRFHSSDNTSAYQLISSRICQRRRYTFYKLFECSKVSLQYKPILNSHCHCSLWPGLAMNDAHRNDQKVIRVE